MDKAPDESPVESAKGVLRTLLKEGRGMETLLCRPGCPYVDGPHSHVISEGIELVVDDLTDEIVLVVGAW